MGIADFGRIHRPVRKLRHCHAVQLSGKEHSGKNILRLPQHNFIRLRPDFRDKDRMAERDSKPFALADCVAGDPPVPAKYGPVCRHKISRRRRLLPAYAVNIPRIIFIRNKTDLLAVLFLRHRKSKLFRNRTDLLLGIIPDRHQRPRKLLLRQTVEGICLIFFRSHGTADGISACGQPLHPGIMSGRNIIRADLQTPVQQRLPFHITITRNAGIRRPSQEVFRRKIIHHMSAELLLKIHHIIGNPKALRHPAGILHGCKPAAAAVLFLPDLHCDAGHITALPLQQIRRHRGIHTA